MKLDAVRSRLIDSRDKPSGDLRVDHHAGARRQLALLAARRVRRPLSRGEAATAALRRRSRSRHARGGRGAALARADAARPHPPPAVHRAFPRLRLGRISQEGRPAAHGRRSRPSPAGRLRRADGDASSLRSQFAADGRARAEESRARRISRSTISPPSSAPSSTASASRCCRTIASRRTPGWCGCCRRPTCRRWIVSSSTPRR